MAFLLRFWGPGEQHGSSCSYWDEVLLQDVSTTNDISVMADHRTASTRLVVLFHPSLGGLVPVSAGV